MELHQRPPNVPRPVQIYFAYANVLRCKIIEIEGVQKKCYEHLTSSAFPIVALQETKRTSSLP